MKSLFLIPARGGSKGIPHKNIKPLNGKPLICYAIDIAREFAADEDICVSTDDNEIVKCVEGYGLKVPFVRPAELATDGAGSYDVMLHAVSYYESIGRKYDTLVLLQPTSPFRRKQDVVGCLNLYSSASCDMVVSVKPSSANPYYDIYEADENGFLKISKGEGRIVRRQEAPKCFEYNGAVYVIDIKALKKQNLSNFKRIRFYEMDEIHSVDLDTMLDWKYAELLINEKVI